MEGKGWDGMGVRIFPPSLVPPLFWHIGCIGVGLFFLTLRGTPLLCYGILGFWIELRSLEPRIGGIGSGHDDVRLKERDVCSQRRVGSQYTPALSVLCF